jgi:hypothetical protein
MAITKNLFSIFAAIFLLTACQQSPKAGFPDIKPNQFWINSIPSGLPCYVAKEGSTSSPEDFFTSGNQKGKTPVLLVLEPGTYDVGFLLPAGSKPDAEFVPRFNAHLGHVVISDKNNEKVVYSYVVKDSTYYGLSFIGLAFSNELSHEEVSKLYPSGNNFVFDEQKVRAVLVDRSVKEEEIQSSLELLRRGGKILLSHKSSAKRPTTIEIKPNQNFEVVPSSVK